MLKKPLLLVMAVLLMLTLFAPMALADETLLIYFFPGGPPGCPFATVVYNGALAAADILGDKVDVRYRWSDWNPERMVTQFQEAIADNPHGIAIMGHPGVDAYEPFVEEAMEKGIIVTTQNVDLPELQARYLDQGFGYAGQELYASGYTLGEAAVRMSGLGSGDRALVWGLKSQPVRGLRSQGAEDALKDAGLVVDYMEISAEVNKDAAAGIPVISGYLIENSDCKLVITDHGGLTSTQDIYFESAGLEPGDVFGAGFDISPATVDAIESGYTNLVLDQQPFLQGFLPIFQIYLSHHYAFSGLHIDTGAGLVHAGNIGIVAPLAEKGLR